MCTILVYIEYLQDKMEGCVLKFRSSSHGCHGQHTPLLLAFPLEMLISGQRPRVCVLLVFHSADFVMQHRPLHQSNICDVSLFFK